VLVAEARGETTPESSAIIDYLDRYHPGVVRFTSADPDQAWRTRLWDRFFDLHIHDPVQRIVADRNRPRANKDPFGVEQAHAKLATAYRVAEVEAAKRTWFSGDGFGLADCAAAPALYYANKVQPFREEQATVKAYLERLAARPSFARVLHEAEPFFRLFPQE
jgi:glutathione S-transferase